MLWNSSAPQVVQQVLQGASVAANQARKKEAAKRLDYFHDQHMEHLAAQLAKRYAEPGKLLPYVVNITRKVVTLLAQIYQEPPARSLADGSEKDQELYQEIVDHSGMDAKLKTASRYTKLLKTILIRPVFRNGRMDIDLLTPNILDVEVGDSPEELKSVLITHYGQSNNIEEVTYSFWTPETVRKFDYRGRELEAEDNPYLILPFVPCWDRAPVEGAFWQSGGDDLIIAQEGLNQLLVALCYTLQMQGFGVGFVSGMEQEGEITLGQGSMLTLPKDAKLGFASTNAPIEEFVTACDWLLKQTAVSNGLPAGSLQTEPTQESGVSKIVSNRELDELRRDDVGLWRRYEKQLFQITRTIWNHHNPNLKLSEKARLKIDFAEPRQITTETEQAEAWRAWMDLGAVNEVDLALERNPDLQTREDALAHLLKLREERAALQEDEF